MTLIINNGYYVLVDLVYQTRYIMKTSNATAYLISAFLLQKIADLLEQSQFSTQNSTG